MNYLPQSTALVLIDVQKGFDDPSWGPRNNSQAEENMARLLKAWRATSRPVFYIQHLSRHPDSPLRAAQVGNEIKEIVTPAAGEPIIRKDVNSAFIGTDLEARLRRANLQTLVIAGLTTAHCVSTTARMAGNLGFETYVVADATASFDLIGHDGKLYTAEAVHALSLATLHREFATIIETRDALRLLGHNASEAMMAGSEAV